MYKKFIKIGMAAALMFAAAATSCKKDGDDDSNDNRGINPLAVPITAITAIAPADDGVSTKVWLDGTDKNVLKWKTGDRIYLVLRTDATTFSAAPAGRSIYEVAAAADITGGGKTATFTFVSGTAIVSGSSYVAWHTGNAGAGTVAAQRIEYAIPASVTQTATDAYAPIEAELAFASDPVAVVAGTTPQFAFKHAMAMVECEISSAAETWQIDRVTIAAPAGQNYFAGQLRISPASPTVLSPASPRNSQTVVLMNGTGRYSLSATPLKVRIPLMWNTGVTIAAGAKFDITLHGTGSQSFTVQRDAIPLVAGNIYRSPIQVTAAPTLETLNVGLIAGSGSITLLPQTAAAGFTFRYASSGASAAAPAYGANISTVSGTTAAYTANTTINGTNGTPIFVRVYKVNAGSQIVGFGEASATPTAAPAIAIVAAGLDNLKVGQAVSGASITYALTNGTYAAAGTITAASFAPANLPPGLTANTATRTNGATVTVTITGTPTTHNASARAIGLPASIPMANVTGATANITPTGTVTASAVAKGNGAAMSANPAVSGTPTQTGITVGAVSVSAPNPGSQTAEYGISTSASTAPTAWQDGRTFTGLSAATDYYVYARSKENANYNAGATRVSAAIKTAAATVPAIAITSTGLTGLKVGQAVSGATIVYTLTNGTYAASITATNFAVSNLPAGLSAGTATRTSNTVVTVTITGTPTAYNASAANVSLPTSIAATNVVGATAGIAPTGTVQASAVARGDGAAVSVPAVSGTPTSSSITVGAVTVSTPNPGSQTAEYGISTSTSTSPAAWQDGATFSSLTAGTAYYVYARTKANTNYNAGTPQRSAAISTAAAGNGGGLPGDYGIINL
jgi:hypothetical protein